MPYCSEHGHYATLGSGPCPYCQADAGSGPYAEAMARQQEERLKRAQEREAEERYPLELQERQTVALESIAASLDILALPVRRYFQMEALVETYRQERTSRKEKG